MIRIGFIELLLFLTPFALYAAVLSAQSPRPRLPGLGR